MKPPQTELLDEFSEQSDDIQAQLSAQPDANVIGFRNASFSWASSTGGSAAPTPGSGRRNFNLRIDGDLMFNKGKINLIIGPTGSGKSSLLMALLGEMHYIPAGPDSFFSLPRTGGVAYAAQESWVQNETIRVRGSSQSEVSSTSVLTSLRRITSSSARRSMNIAIRKVWYELCRFAEYSFFYSN